MASKPSGLRPPTKVFARPPGLPLSNSNLPNTAGASGDQHEAAGAGGSTSSQPSPSGSMASLRSKEYSSTRVDSSSSFSRRGMADGIVLNNDTDSFIIGETVWVGGEKRGRIAFLGETQFGKGDWGGIVLDEPIGKNDGSVSGVRYFYCEKNHGVFVRLTRLTRQPLRGVESSFGLMTPRQNSPTPRILKSPSPGDRSSSRLGSPGPQLKLDERVIVQSSTGTKKGILRYIGTTDFANGEWAGIELDTPNGKNDGSVGGRRYFDCRPQYGLFAPIHKVTSSPANKHATSGLRRHGSKESMTSNLSSVASSRPYQYRSSRKSSESDPSRAHGSLCLPSCSLQNVLKEKERHLEHLLQEKDLDRQELAQAMLKLEESQKELLLIKANLAKADGDALKQHAAIQAQFEAVKQENESLKTNLEEFQRKYDDLLFTSEEDKITRAELQSQFDACKQELVQAKAVTASVSSASDSATVEMRERLDSLVKQNEKLNQDLESFRTELNAKNVEISNLQSSLQKAESEALSKSNITSDAENEIKKLTKIIDEANAKRQTLESELGSVNNQKARLEEANHELETSNKMLTEELNGGKLTTETLVKDLNEKISVMTEALRAAEDAAKSTSEKMKADAVEMEKRQGAELDAMKKALSESQTQFNNMQAKCEEAASVNQKAQERMNTYQIEMDKLTKKLQKSDEKATFLENMLQQAKIESEGTTSQIEAKTKEIINQLNNEVAAKNERIALLAEEIESLKTDCQKNISIMQTKEKNEKELNEIILSSDKKIEVLLAEKAEMDLVKVKNEADLKSAIEERDKLCQNEKQSNETILSNQKKIEELSTEIELLKVKSETDLKSAVEEKNKLHQELKAKNAEEIRLNELVRDMEAGAISSQIELQKARKEFAEGRARLIEDFKKSEEDTQKYLKAHVERNTEYESEIKALKEEVERYKGSSEKTNSQLELKNAEIEKLNQMLNIANEKCVRYENSSQLRALDASEKEEKLMHTIKQLEDLIVNKDKQIEKLVSEQQAVKSKTEKTEQSYKEKEARLEATQKELESLTALNKNLAKELETAKSRESALAEAHQAEISRLAQSQSEALNALHKLESSQKQKEEIIAGLNREISSLSLKNTKESVGNTDPSLSANHEAHVNFLNSIIVDLQNEKQKLNEKLAVFVSGAQVPDANSNVKMEEKSKKTLRMYCDICEEFDVHETEDCPVQASEPDQNSKHGAARGSERPYCDVCEVFGHWTSDCDDGETF